MDSIHKGPFIFKRKLKEWVLWWGVKSRSGRFIDNLNLPLYLRFYIIRITCKFYTYILKCFFLVRSKLYLLIRESKRLHHCTIAWHFSFSFLGDLTMAKVSHLPWWKRAINPTWKRIRRGLNKTLTERILHEWQSRDPITASGELPHLVLTKFLLCYVYWLSQGQLKLFMGLWRGYEVAHVGSAVKHTAHCLKDLWPTWILIQVFIFLLVRKVEENKVTIR